MFINDKLSQTYFNVAYCKAIFSYEHYSYFTVRNKIRIIRAVALWINIHVFIQHKDRQCWRKKAWPLVKVNRGQTGVSIFLAQLRRMVIDFTRISCCRWQTRATRCITANVLQTSKVDTQCDKLATELSWQRFASKVANFRPPQLHLTYSTCTWRLRCGDHVYYLARKLILILPSQGGWKAEST